MTTPAHKVFESSPVTVLVQYRDEQELWIGASAEWEAGGFSPYSLSLYGMSDLKLFPLSELDEVAPKMWRGRVVAGVLDSPEITVRPTVEADAISAITTAGYPRVPMPLTVLSSLLESDVSTMPTLWAMSDDDGFVVTMMLNSDAGLYVRYSAAWFRITDPEIVSGLSATEVDDASLEMFDQFDQAGQMVALSAFRQNGAPLDTPIAKRGSVAVAEPEVVESTITDVKAVPVLSSAADLDGAIAAAREDESLQWYVERRAAALGLDADFPWRQ